MKTTTFLAVALTGALSLSSAQAALYTTALGANAGDPSDCDDCFSGPFAFGGGHTIDFFGNTYSGLFVGSNGYVTFGSGASNFSTAPLNTQAIRPMIAGSFTDLDSRDDLPSNVFVNSSTPGQLIVTWQDMGHFSTNYSVTSTFQLVVRSDQFVVPGGEGQIGFFYGLITDGAATSAGFGDGLSAINPGEVAFHSQLAGTQLSNASPRWYLLDAGVPTESNGVPLPGSAALLGVGLAGLFGALRRRVA